MPAGNRRPRGRAGTAQVGATASSTSPQDQSLTGPSRNSALLTKVPASLSSEGFSCSMDSRLLPLPSRGTPLPRADSSGPSVHQGVDWTCLLWFPGSPRSPPPWRQGVNPGLRGAKDSDHPGRAAPETLPETAAPDPLRLTPFPAAKSPARPHLTQYKQRPPDSLKDDPRRPRRPALLTLKGPL